MLPELPLPEVPAVEPGELELVDPELALGLLDDVEPVALPPADVLPVEAELPVPEPMRALVSMNWPARPALLLAVEPAVPVVPVAPAVLPPPCRHPVTVTVRLLLLPEV